MPMETGRQQTTVRAGQHEQKAETKAGQEQLKTEQTADMKFSKQELTAKHETRPENVEKKLLKKCKDLNKN